MQNCVIDCYLYTATRIMFEWISVRPDSGLNQIFDSISLYTKSYSRLLYVQLYTVLDMVGIHDGM